MILTRKFSISNEQLISLSILLPFLAPLLSIIGINSVLYPSYAIIALLYVAQNKKIYLKHLILCILLLLPWALTFMRFGISEVLLTTNFYEFIIILFCIPVLFSEPLDFNLLVKKTLYIYTSLLPTLIMFNSSDFDYGSLMGWSYAVLPVFMVSLFIIFNRKKFSSNIILLSILNISIYGAVFMPIMNRGAWLTLLIYFLYLKYRSTAYDARKLVSLFLVILLLILIVSNIEYSLSIFQATLDKFEISVRFIDKNLHLLQENGIDNGRFILYSMSFDSFLNSPLLGNGVGSFYRIYNLNYEHSILFQILNELGLLFSMLHFILIFKTIKILIKDKESVLSSIISFFSILSLVRLNFSSSLWINPHYFIFIYLSYNYRTLLKKYELKKER